MFLSNLNSFNSLPSPLDQRFAQQKGSSKVWKEKSSEWFSFFFFSLSFSPTFCFMHYLCVLLTYCWVSLVLCYFLFPVLLYFVCHKKIEKKYKKYKKSVCFVYIGTCVPWMAIKTKFSKLCISCSLNENLNAQLSKWVLWLVFVTSTIK